MSGSDTSRTTYRGMVAGRAGANGQMTFEDGVELMFNSKAIVMDQALGMAGGQLSFGLNQVVKSAGAARATRTSLHNLSLR